MEAHCRECGVEYSTKRASLGYSTCLECGANEATIERRRRAKCVAPAYNKGAYQYVPTIDVAREIGR